MSKHIWTTAALVIMFVAGSATLAQNGAVPEWYDATIIETDRQQRTITVRFDANEETGTYPVGKDAELVRVLGTPLEERPITFEDLRIGDDVRLTFEDMEGRTTLRRILSRSLDD